MSLQAAPPACPQPIAADTWLIPRLAPAGDAGFIYLNSLVIRGEQPVLVDTGASVHAAAWQEDVFSLVEPADVAWVFISHQDADHAGNLPLVLDLCPNATVVTDFLGLMKLGLMAGLPPRRARWLNPGGALDIGDRVLMAVLPPLFDSPGTRGLLDSSTGVLWAADCFAGPTTGAIYEASELPPGMWAETFVPFNSMENPWHAWLDATAFGAHVEAVAALPMEVVASCHGPVLRDGYIRDAFAMVSALAGSPAQPLPGHPVLEQIIAGAMAAEAVPT